MENQEQQKIYTREEVYQATKDYFNGDELATDVWINKYALQDNNGNLLEKTPTDMHWRLANEFSRIEQRKYVNTELKPLSAQEIFDLFDHFKYLCAQGSPMAGIGNSYTYQSLGNCFSLGYHPYDSYGGICYTDQMLVQLSKRRCVEENSCVITKFGPVKIKDVNIEDEILSHNIDTHISSFKKVKTKFITDVEKQNRIIITLSNGTKLRTSKLHPVLTIINSKLQYIQAGQLKINDILIKPEYNISDLFNFKEDLVDIGWWIGAHIGDGTCDIKKQLKGDAARFRINGDEENVVNKYAYILNKLTGHICNTSVANAKRYKSKVWQYSHCSVNAKKVLEKYLDNQYGSKVYSAKIPKFIIDNNLWIPFLAGLIDTDGYVRKEKTIDILICAKDVVETLVLKLNQHGIDCYYREKQPKRPNERTLYKLSIHSNQNFQEKIAKYLYHKNKKNICDSNVRIWSRRIPLTENEIKNILNLYYQQTYSTNKNPQTKEQRKRYACLSNAIAHLKKYKSIGIAGLLTFVEFKLLEKYKISEVQQRLSIVDITQDLKAEKYIDIEIEDNHNFFCGNNGLVNIHNCGVGLCVDNLRPKGMVTKNAAKTTDGIIVFVKRFANSIREVAQQGRRGGALIGLSVHHPEIEQFINLKRNREIATGVNISVIFTDEFMKALLDNKEYEQRWPIEGKIQISKLVKAKDIWDKFIDASHNCGEPGALWIDTARKHGLSHAYHVKDKRFADVITNTCGEIWQGMDACRLMVINTLSYVEHPFTNNPRFNYKLFAEHCQVAQRLMDDMVDLEEEKILQIIKKIESDPEPDYIKQSELRMWNEFLEITRLGRRTGLGLTSIGDTLAALNIKYDSEDAFKKIEKIYKTLAVNSMKSSCLLAKELGTFPLYDKDVEKDQTFLKNLFKYDEELKELHEKYGRRNISNTTSSPSGTISTLMQTTSGIEPCYLLEYSRKRKVNKDDKNTKITFIDKVGDCWEEYTVKHHGFELWSKITGKTNIKDSPYYKSTANDIDWLSSVKIQAIAQQFLTHSISKTCNLPKSTSKELVSQVYLKAYEEKCKGFTVYRDGCRDGVLTKKKTSEENKRPKELPCDVHHISIKGQKYIVMVGIGENGKPYEVFSCKNSKFDSKIKTGKIIRKKKNFYKAEFEDGTELSPITLATSEMEDAITRLTSALLREGADMNLIVTQLEKVEGEDLHSYAKSLARALKHYCKDNTPIEGELCPECNSQIVRKDGCWSCSSCQWSRCQ